MQFDDAEQHRLGAARQQGGREKTAREQHPEAECFIHGGIFACGEVDGTAFLRLFDAVGTDRR